MNRENRENSEDLQKECGSCGHSRINHTRINPDSSQDYGSCSALECDCKNFEK